MSFYCSYKLQQHISYITIKNGVGKAIRWVSVNLGYYILSTHYCKAGSGTRQMVNWSDAGKPGVGRGGYIFKCHDAAILVKCAFYPAGPRLEYG